MLECHSLLTYMGLIKCFCVFRYLDFISVKTFDLHGDQDKVTAHHSSLYSENKSNIVITPFLPLLCHTS